MKNISRRVFIKGMAVAAVATAASTVLAGCNTAPVNPGEQPEVVPSNQTCTYTDLDGKTLTVSTTGVEYYTTGNSVVVSIQVLNNTALDFVCNPSAAVSKAEYFVNPSEIKIYFDDNKNKVGSIISESGVMTKDSTVASKNSATGKLYIATVDFEKWSKMTVVVPVKEYIDANRTNVVKEMEFTFNK